MEKPNLSYIEKLSGGDDSFKQKIITILKDEFPVERVAYQKALAAQDFKLTTEIVHKLKHKVSILNLEKSHHIVNDYENNLKKGDDGLSTKFKMILDVIENYLKEL